MKNYLIFVFAVLFLFSCSAKQVEIQPLQNLKNINQNIKILIKSEDVNNGVLEELDRYLRAQLIIAGFNLVQDSSDSIALNVDVILFEPGNQAARLFIGFGAGRGSLVYSVQYHTSDGVVLASMSGQERFTGGDVAYNIKYGSTTGFGGPDVVQNILCQEAAGNIIKLALNQLSNTNKK